MYILTYDHHNFYEPARKYRFTKTSHKWSGYLIAAVRVYFRIYGCSTHTSIL